MHYDDAENKVQMIFKLEQTIIELWQSFDLLGTQDGKNVLTPKAKHKLIKAWNEGLPKKRTEGILGIGGSTHRDGVVNEGFNQAIDEMKITDHRVIKGVCKACGYEN